MMGTLSEQQKQALERDGYVVFPGVLSQAMLARIIDCLETLWAEEGAAAGQENYNAVEANVRRLANLANKGDIFRELFAHPLVLAAAELVMGPDVRLSMLNAREVPAQVEGAKQPFHSDTDNSGKPDRRGFYSCTAVWMLDAFTADNGATRIVPGTHLSGQVPREGMADPYADHPDEVVMQGNAGDVAVFNGHCWHAGGLNTTPNPRRAILAHYLRADI
ncbi:MAG: phytanoyl-CoA dioxygenase family protein, partial [Anaerolineae bacterium]|nr:phytanoyl-CoA dioxygenase family protein [Anaerolineae bacterium]